MATADPRPSAQILCPACNGAITDPTTDGIVAFHGPCWERLRQAIGPMFLSTVLQKLPGRRVVSGGEFDLSTEISNPRITPGQRRGAGVVAAGWCLRNAGLHRGEPLSALGGIAQRQVTVCRSPWQVVGTEVGEPS